ncbi:MAG: FliH/SctL family protein [Chloroherpetonaceae bacterium]|nr:FliH/SctL family protein [Chthonomonadaceae bacterium]MDW8208742.1 FliH/SctL family protein [Chloroherpetonaceae bacterium]
MTTEPHAVPDTQQHREDTFLPLTAPHVAPPKPAPPEPVSWFTHLAPRLPEPDPAPSTPAAREPNDACPVTFPDLEQVATMERALSRREVAEPPEIAEMRRQACEAAETIVQQAMEQAEKILQEAQQSGYQAGYAQGYAEGEAAARQLLTQQADTERVALREEIAAFIAHIEAQRRKIWQELEPQIIGLVFDLARKVIKQEVEVNRDVALSMVRNALRRVADSTSLRIRVHQEDLETVRAARQELLTLLDGVPHVEIVADRRVGPGGCIVETECGNIDARIETQMDTIADVLQQMTMAPRQAA